MPPAIPRRTSSHRRCGMMLDKVQLIANAFTGETGAVSSGHSFAHPLRSRWICEIARKTSRPPQNVVQVRMVKPTKVVSATSRAEEPDACLCLKPRWRRDPLRYCSDGTSSPLANCRSCHPQATGRAVGGYEVRRTQRDWMSPPLSLSQSSSSPPSSCTDMPCVL